MKDEEAGNASDEIAAPPARSPHHGEALVAALLNTQRAALQSPQPSVEDSPVSPPATPLTASSVIDHTIQTEVPGPATAAEVAGGHPRPSGGQPDEVVAGATPPERESPVGDGEAPLSSEDPSEDDGDGLVRNLLEWFVVLGAAVAVAILLRTFVFQAFFIPSESMEQTLYEGDRILVNKVGYRLHDVNRGDVVVFRRPDDQPGEIRDLIKRVIGLPGDSVEGRDSTIFIDGRELVEPYLDGNYFADFGPITVPEGELFMMGDNRDQSLDSRRFGTIEADRVVGRAFVLFWPLDRLGTL